MMGEDLRDSRVETVLLDDAVWRAFELACRYEGSAKDRAFVSQMRTDAFRAGGCALALLDQSGPAGLNVTRLDVRPRGGVRYAYLISHLVLPRARGRGVARALLAARTAAALADGCSRLRAKVGTDRGLRFHLAEGHALWRAPGGSCLVDTPIGSAPALPVPWAESLKALPW